MKKAGGVFGKGIGKSGQFYLITAVVIAGIIMGISAISNYSKKEGNPGIEKLKEEIKIESQKTLDYGINSKFNSAQINQLMQNFTNYYISYEGRGNKDIYFLFGNSDNITVSGYQKAAKTVSLSDGATQVTITQQSGNFTGSINPSGNGVTLNISGKQNTFNLKPAENFYFVITQDISGEEYITTG